jgi:hypothetical protein
MGHGDTPVIKTQENQHLMSATRTTTHNTTHRKTIARTLSKQAGIPYSRARRLVDLAAEQNLLPAALTPSAVTAAVSMLASERVMSMLLAPSPKPITAAQAGTAFRARLTSLGFAEDDQDRLITALAIPNARVLCTGRTFTGKTTTQYAIMEYLRDTGLTVASAEDPLERTLPGIHQIEAGRTDTLDATVRSLTDNGQRWDVTNIAELRTAAAAQTFLFGPGIRIAATHAGTATEARNRFSYMDVTGDLFDHCVDLVIEHHVFKSACHHLPRPQMLDSEQAQRLQTLVPSADLAVPVPMNRQCAECTTSGTPKREYVRTSVSPASSEGPSKAAAAAWELVSAGRMTVDQFLDAFPN